MKLLVTGGAGFMGSDFIRYIVENKFVEKVVNLDLLTYSGNIRNCISIASNPIYTFVKGNICDNELVRKICEKHNIDSIINFAAETHVDRSINDISPFIESNIIGTKNLLEIVREKDLRFHQISTDEVYGSLELDDKPFNENSNYNPRNPYSATKAGADHLVKSFHNTFGIKSTISNSSNNYGPHQFAEKLIPLTISNIINNKKVQIYGSGDNIREWLFVRDHSKAVWEILKSTNYGESYCIGGDNQLSNNELVRKIISLLENNDSIIEYIEDRKGHDFRYELDTSKIKSAFGWKPETTIEQGLIKTVEWYKENPTACHPQA